MLIILFSKPTTSGVGGSERHFVASSSRAPVTELKRLTTQNSLLQTYIISQSQITKSTTKHRLEQASFTSRSPDGAHSLIDCKDNDFGLECSCSIALSPPKCKRLINSFLSSCRVLGCQNSGQCVNMTGDFPSKPGKSTDYELG